MPSLSAGTLCLPFVLFGAMITIHLSGVVHKPHAPNEADEFVAGQHLSGWELLSLRLAVAVQ